MKFRYQIPLFFLAGSILYPIIELLYRGWTHLSMCLLGGLALVAVILVDNALGERRFLLKAGLSTVLITQMEFIFGVYLNLHRRLAVWDYSDRLWDIAGQVCPLFSFYWFLLSLGCILFWNFAQGKISLPKKKTAADS